MAAAARQGQRTFAKRQICRLLSPSGKIIAHFREAVKLLRCDLACRARLTIVGPDFAIYFRLVGKS